VLPTDARFLPHDLGVLIKKFGKLRLSFHVVVCLRENEIFGENFLFGALAAWRIVALPFGRAC